MKRIHYYLSFAAALLVAAVSPASVRADTVNFNFRGDPLLSYSAAPSMTFLDTTTGLDVKVTGQSSAGAALVTRTGLGLGVSHTGDPIVGVPLLDGLWSNESLTFDFTPESVVLNKLTFSLADRNDSLALVVSKISSAGTPIVFDLQASNNWLNYEFDLAAAGISAADRTGLKFKLTSHSASTAVAIAGMTVNYAAVLPAGSGATTPAAVPLPSVAGAGALLLAGLAVKRRHGQAAGSN